MARLSPTMPPPPMITSQFIMLPLSTACLGADGFNSGTRSAFLDESLIGNHRPKSQTIDGIHDPHGGVRSIGMAEGRIGRWAKEPGQRGSREPSHCQDDETADDLIPHSYTATPSGCRGRCPKEAGSATQPIFARAP